MYPKIVFGQDDNFESGLSNGNNRYALPPTEKTLSFLPYPNLPTIGESPRSIQMALDSNGNLYVPDLNNNRVLRYNSPFEKKSGIVGSGDTVADSVYGQDSFSEKSKNELNIRWKEYNVGVFVFESQNNLELWVTDSGNDRIVMYGHDDKTNDLSNSIQQEIPMCVTENKLLNFNSPNSILVDENHDIFVLDNDAETRLIKIFDTANIDPQSTPSCEIIFSGNMPYFGLYWARGMNFDPFNKKHIWVMDGGYHRVVKIDVDPTSKDYKKIIDIIGKPSRISNYKGGNEGGITDDSFPHAWLRQPDGGIGFDSDGNMYVPSNGNNEVTIFPLLHKEYTEVIESGTNKKIRLLKPLGGFFGNEINMVTRRAVDSSLGLSVFCGQLIVSDGTNKRLMAWNNYGRKKDGSAADAIINDEILGLINQQAISIKNRLLFVAGNDRIIVYTLPIKHDNQKYYKIIDKLYWNDDKTEVGIFQPQGIVFDDKTDALWISEPQNNRVLRVQNPLSEKPFVDIVLGQKTKKGKWCNGIPEFDLRGPSDSGSKYSGFLSIPKENTLCNPWFLNIDRAGRLFVVDGFYDVGFGNKRVIAYKLDQFKDVGEDEILFAPDFDYVFSGASVMESDHNENYVKADSENIPYDECEQAWPCIPVYVSFVDDDMYVTVDSYGNPQYQRLFVFEKYMEHYDKYLEKTMSPKIIDIPLGQGAFHTFDSQGNFILQDFTWNTILVYNGQKDHNPSMSMENVVRS
ncbi:MAG: hypothetical protein KKF44_01980 [Nanoarchaeota archaeon]|nr:hypothetical protein [Nanoarchaeota archaeon]